MLGTGRGGQDSFGPYEPVPGWPKDISTLPGNDENHFGRPTFMAFLPDAIFVADGYVNSRVVKFDADGNYLMEWGQEGVLPNDTRPGYFNSLHGIDVDPASGRVYISDRQNNRMQVFTSDGEFVMQWPFGPPPSDTQYLIVAHDAVWVIDAGTTKLLKYDLDGNFEYSWGTWGRSPGGMWGVHGMSVDEEGNFYIAEVNNGRVQKFRPREGVDPNLLVSRVHPSTNRDRCRRESAAITRAFRQLFATGRRIFVRIGRNNNLLL